MSVEIEKNKMENPLSGGDKQIPKINFPHLDNGLVEECIAQANGDIAKVAELLAKSVGPLGYDDEDGLLEYSDEELSESSEDKCKIENSLPPSINTKWENLKAKLTPEELDVMENVLRLRMYKMCDSLVQSLFEKH
ncbi:hypothetical protein EIN_391560 [Entamoeba invadens IP1]|uniref:Uncharacterized protein n=1 Tax=Entamoeba invadens IP1 TaxID=370355 RepID=A0A0A1UBC0_ENTIV|nr:hypothetical protein EIN_391560 [Entamoeba invadens IP1]ELP89501.1 hypothetical protein EIN_391560 [Entamoeba invadens IP1]|eukprot:XP_004256272.1 hypothetical protein EIN_391560 [Entamoeba invadens IP1]